MGRPERVTVARADRYGGACHHRGVTAQPGEGEVLERAAEGRYFEGDYAGAARYEQAYAAYRREGRIAACGRAARTHGWISGGVFGDRAVESGWLARARSVLAEAGPDGPEHGWLLILRSFGEDDPGARESLLREARETGRRCGEPDVEPTTAAFSPRPAGGTRPRPSCSPPPGRSTPGSAPAGTRR